MEITLRELAAYILGVDPDTFLGFRELANGGVSLVAGDGKKFTLSAETLGDAYAEWVASLPRKVRKPKSRKSTR